MIRWCRSVLALGTFLCMVGVAHAQNAPAADEAPAEGSAEGAASEAATTGAAGEETAAEGAEPAEGEKAATAGVAPEAGETMDGPTYQVRLRDLEQRVDELKEQIRRSHTRLSLLSDTILSGGVGGARAEIEFVNELSGAFKVVEAVFVLDGAVQYKKADDTGTLAAQETIPIFSGSIPTGDHTLQVLVRLRGHGYGVFSYLRGYKFEVRSDHSFTITDGKTIELKAIAYETGGATTPLEERPAVRYVENIRAMGEGPGAAPASAPSSPPAPAAPPGDASGEGSVDTSGSVGDGSGSGSGSAGGGLSVGGGN